VVLVVYLPFGGNGGHPPTDFGATIDAFDESTNQLVSDTFVTASPDGGQTSSGNVDGWVDTTSNTEIIAAFQHITPTNANFDKWVNLQQPTSTQGIAGVDLTVNKGTNASALAFYKALAPPPPDPCAALQIELDNISPGDFRTEAEFEAAFRSLSAQLLACRKKFGKP
jgi:hypothetical protein